MIELLQEACAVQLSNCEMKNESQKATVLPIWTWHILCDGSTEPCHEGCGRTYWRSKYVGDHITSTFHVKETVGG